MEVADFSQLELEVGHLLSALEELQLENKHLRNQLARYAREKSLIYQQNRQTADKIKKIISYLQGAMG